MVVLVNGTIMHYYEGVVWGRVDGGTGMYNEEPLKIDSISTWFRIQTSIEFNLDSNSLPVESKP
jgi:hypothetical protein